MLVDTLKMFVFLFWVIFSLRFTERKANMWKKLVSTRKTANPWSKCCKH